MGWVAAGALIILAVLVISPVASADPDGLERVAEDTGFLSAAQSSPYEIIPDYTVPVLGGTPLSTILAGLVGALIVFGVILLIGKALASKKAN